MMNAIEINGLTKKYGEKTAVNRISLKVEGGTLASFLGVNGAGKTTLIKMLCGLTAPDEGDALLCGFSIRDAANEVKSRINVSPQETAVARNLTVRENLIMIAGIYGCSKADAVKKADEMIEEFHLSEYSRSRASTLSGGWQRRLSIAMALISQPEVLFLDEPTLGLDVIARRELWTIIEKLKGKVTVILTTHYLEEAEALSDKIYIIAHGTLRAEGTSAEILAESGCDKFEDAFVKIASAE